jgi:hypothetical protein
MNTSEAIAHLEKQGWKINKKGNSYQVNRIGRGVHYNYASNNFKGNDLYSARELVKFARIFSSDNNQSTKLRKNLKEFSNGPERAHVRDLVKLQDEERLEDLSKNKVTTKEDVWSWD